MGALKTLVDSGGYSAWRLGNAIDLNAYCEFLEQNSDWVSLYVVLDHIAPEEPEEAAQISFDNLKEMRRRGFNPIPIWHARESLDWIDRFLDLGCDYIGFSTTSARGHAIDNALELAWSKVVNSAGDPTVHVHAFGNSHVPTLFKYPWASADSSSWLRGPKWGRIMLHGIPTGRLNHRHTTKRVHDDVIFPDLDEILVHTNHARDISMVEGEDLDLIREQIEALDIDLDDLRENRKSRRTWLSHAYIAATFFIKLEKQVRSLPRPKFRPSGGFVTGGGTVAPAVTLPEFDLFMAVNVSPSVLCALVYAGNRRPLCSYYYINSHNQAARMRTWHGNPDGLLSEPSYQKYAAMLEEWITPNAS